MREIEFEPVAEFRAEVGLAGRVVDELYLARASPDVTPHDVTQHSARDNPTPPIALETETRTASTFIGRESAVETNRCFRPNVQTRAPDMHFAGCQLKRAG